MPIEVPWPRKGDLLFDRTDDGWYNTTIGGAWNRWPVYAAGYKHGADVLVQHVVGTPAAQESLIYPIIFLYRHSLELALKHLILLGWTIMGRDGNGEPVTRQSKGVAKLFREHRLSSLWEKCRPVIEHLCPRDSRGDDDAVGDILKQFDGKDPLGQKFRYPADTDGNPFFSAPEQINIRHLADVANRVSTFLDSCWDCFDSSNDGP
ncbi:MAG: hypothetical protein ABSG86_11100 [Thermoguttaceae bacterium]|jgi:hypothetical protein